MPIPEAAPTAAVAWRKARLRMVMKATLSKQRRLIFKAFFQKFDRRLAEYDAIDVVIRVIPLIRFLIDPAQ
jgi:hypothetical protein